MKPLPITTVLAVLISAAVIAGCVGQTPAGGNATIEHCGSDMACFNQAQLACQPADVTYVNETIGAEEYVKINGLTADGKCSFYTRISNYNNNISMDVTCNFPQALWASPDITLEDTCTYCTGDMADQLRAQGACA